MKKIMFNLNTKAYRYLEDTEVTSQDIPLSTLHQNIVLASINEVRTFKALDLNNPQKEVIQDLIRTGGFKPITKEMGELLAQRYSICPNCGEDIDFNTESELSIWHLGTSFKNLVTGNIYPAKPITCHKCGEENLYFYDIFSSVQERREVRQNDFMTGKPVFIKINYVLNTEKMCYIPVMIALEDFTKFFKQTPSTNNEITDDFMLDDEDVEAANKSDLNMSLLTKEDRTILATVFNPDMQKYAGVENLRAQLLNIRLGNYSKYSTDRDFSLIEIYKNNTSSEQLLEMILD